MTDFQMLANGEGRGSAGTGSVAKKVWATQVKSVEWTEELLELRGEFEEFRERKIYKGQRVPDYLVKKVYALVKGGKRYHDPTNVEYALYLVKGTIERWAERDGVNLGPKEEKSETPNAEERSVEISVELSEGRKAKLSGGVGDIVEILKALT